MRSTSRLGLVEADATLGYNRPSTKRPLSNASVRLLPGSACSTEARGFHLLNPGCPFLSLQRWGSLTLQAYERHERP